MAPELLEGALAFIAGGGLAVIATRLPWRRAPKADHDHDWHIDGKENGVVMQHCPQCGVRRERDGR